MYKTASEIADIVLEKIAVSPQLARKALMSRLGKDLSKLRGKGRFQRLKAKDINLSSDHLVAASLENKYPRAAARAFATPTHRTFIPSPRRGAPPPPPASTVYKPSGGGGYMDPIRTVGDPKVALPPTPGTRLLSKVEDVVRLGKKKGMRKALSDIPLEEQLYGLG